MIFEFAFWRCSLGLYDGHCGLRELTWRVVYTSSYKMDVIEAPSVAVCPFNPGVDVIPAPGVPEEDMIKVVKYGVDGPEYLKTKSYKCDYDRGCMCVNLWSVKDGPVNFQDYRQKDVTESGRCDANARSCVGDKYSTQSRLRIRQEAGSTEPRHSIVKPTCKRSWSFDCCPRALERRNGLRDAS